MPRKNITTDDLWEFKMELLEEIKKLLSQQSSGNLRRYMRSSEVKEHLHISTGTLQTLRINGTLPYVKIGGIIYYDVEEIHRIMTEHRIDNKY
ncbi:helix-turn-helix domain-containing protein [Zunongwangia sp. H14]|uniref:helix-turn-helix domain-containing protein n=1 Tax=Zunongwangia sp. H14 TaxID=3240792 RepID=UPI003563676E